MSLDLPEENRPALNIPEENRPEFDISEQNSPEATAALANQMGRVSLEPKSLGRKFSLRELQLRQTIGKSPVQTWAQYTFATTNATKN